MQILHSYCLNYNLGDYFLGRGLKNLLRHHFDVELIGNTNIQGRNFNKYYINEVVNKKYDLLVIGGGGIIHGKHWPNGWFWLIDLDLIKEIKIPFIIYGVGYNYWQNEGGIPLRGKNHLKESKKYAKYFSVRNDGSAKRLFEQTGIDANIIPDPGFHVNLNSTFERKITDPYVIIQLANDKSEHRFGSIENKNRFIREMRKITKELAQKYKVVFAPHVLDDILISFEISKGIDNVMVWNFGNFAFDNTNEAIGYYKYADFVIAMRGHGQIIPIAFNTPVISLENHPKHRGLMEELGLLDYNINILDNTFSSNLKQAIKNIQQNAIKLVETYETINAKLLDSTNKGFLQIKKTLY